MVRTNKYGPLLDKVQFLAANLQYAYVMFDNGRELSVSVHNLTLTGNICKMNELRNIRGKKACLKNIRSEINECKSDTNLEPLDNPEIHTHVLIDSVNQLSTLVPEYGLTLCRSSRSR